MANRTSKQVFESHLQLRLEGKVEEDIQINYSPTATLISSTNEYFGHEGIRDSAAELEKRLGKAKFTYVKKVVEGEFAYLIWKAETNTKKVEHGADSFLIRNGQIIIQSIYYAVEEKKSNP